MSNLIQMKTACRFTVALVISLNCSLTPAAAESGVVQVIYAHPENFADVGDNSRVTTDRRRDALLAQLTNHVERSVIKRIPAGGALEITVVDIDMTGGFEPWHRSVNHIRVIRSGYPPRIKLEFRLADAAGKTISEGRRELTDSVFMNRVDYRGDTLRYEKKLLDDWLAREFPIVS